MMINPALPPEGILDPQQPWWPTRNIGESTWRRFKVKLTGRKDEYGTQYSSFVNLGDADADRLIENIKKYGQYPQVNQNGKDGGYSNLETYQKWLVEEFLEKPFREQVDEKIVDRQAARRIADILNKKKVQQAADLTADVIQDPWGEGTVPAKQYAVIPTTKLLPPAKEKAEEPKEVKKRGSSLVKSMTKTFARMETHFQKLTELSEVSEGNVAGIEEAFRIQSDLLVKGFESTTILVNKVSSAVNLQADVMVKVARNKKDLDQKRLDAQEALNQEMQIEQQSSSSGTSKVTGFNKKDPPGGGMAGSIGKIFGSAVIAKLAAGKGLKLAQGGGKVAKMVTMSALEKTMGKGAVDLVAQKFGRKAVEEGIETGLAKNISKKIPLLGLGLSGFFAINRAAKGDMLGAALEIASGAASTIPGAGTAGSLAIDAALMARDSGAVPFAEGGLTQGSTFSSNKKRPGVTDLSPDLFKKMYQYELDYEHKNKAKFAKLYADGYEKYFSRASLPGILESLLSNVVNFFKNLATGLRRGARNLLEIFNPRTGTTTNEFKDVLPEGNPQLTSRFGPRTVSWGSKNHQGIDIGVDRGSRVLALEDGVVTDIYEDFGGHGQAVVVDHQDGTRNIYGHVDAVAKIGDTIKRGNVIATVKYWPGSGAQPADNTHLHLERRTGTSFKPIDPAQYLNERAEQLKQNQPAARARGGPVSAGTPYFVGEEGPELFVPKQSGFVMNNQQTAGLFNWLPNTGRVMAPRGSQYDSRGGTVQKFFGWTVPGSYQRSGYKPEDINRFNRTSRTQYLQQYEAQPMNPDPELDAMYRRNGLQYTDPAHRVRNRTRPSPNVSPQSSSTSRNRYGETETNDPITNTVRGIRNMMFPEEKLRQIEEIQGRPLGNTTNGEFQRQLMDQYGRSTYGEQRRLLGPQSSVTQTDKLLAMAPLEDQMSNSVMVIRVNNTAPPVVIPSSDDGFEQAPTPDFFSQLHLAAIS
jgi:murein DD-endopeptidase MepM/ murein hydrolase activator NlpD